MSLHIAKRFIRPLVLASAAVFFYVGLASAADSAGDTQQRMEELLTGTTTAHYIRPSAGQEGIRVTARTVDSQELVKQMLLGTAGASAQASTHSGVPPASAEILSRGLARRDSQAAVRRVLLGQSHARDAS